MTNRLIIIQPAIPSYRVPLFERLSKLHNLKVIAAKEDFLGVKSILGLHFSTYCSGFFAFLGAFYWLRGLPLLKEYSKGDIVVLNGNPRILNFMILFVLLRLRGITTVWWGHGWTANSFGVASKVRLFIMRHLPSARLLYTDDEVNRLGLDNTFALNNGLDSESIRNAISKVDPHTTTSSSGKLHLVFIGRLTKKSNVSLILDALKLLDNRFHLDVIGDGEELQELVNSANLRGIDSRITWHGRVYNEDQIAKVMLGSHYFIYPGSVGLSLIHAFNYSLPAILPEDKKKHMPEFAAFKEGYNGFSYIDNPHALAELLNKIYNKSIEEHEVLKRNAFETIENTYNLEDMVKRFDMLVRSLSCR
ncbi:glycosyltransferase [Vibrio diabolicus]|uniref:glycosyltransferase n=1 Tax=Vibrio diabolicus TaxID=50719 RepID=UPI0024941E34|nr:glycosyltransferase [Vibrio diabolicus]